MKETRGLNGDTVRNKKQDRGKTNKGKEGRKGDIKGKRRK